MYMDPCGLWAWRDPLSKGGGFSAGWGDMLSFGLCRLQAKSYD